MPPADPAAPGRLSSDAYDLYIRQEPLKGKVVGSREKASDRKPVDPPPIVQLQIKDPSDPAQNYLQSPYFFMCCNLWDPDDDKQAQITQSESPGSPTAPLAGNVASCLHRLKDTNNTDGGFFVFGDVSVRSEGRFRLRFALFELMQGSVVFHKSIISGVFTVYSTKAFPGMAESTFLSRSFGDQGVRLRIRKEARAQKRPSSRGQGGSDSQGYSSGQRPSVSSTPGSLGYSGAGSAYTPTSGREYQGEFQEPPGKRQRSVGPGDRGLYARPQGQDAWAYSQAQQPVNPYGTHAPAPGYGQEAASTPQQPGLAYRNQPSEVGYMPRQHMNEYSTPPQHQVAYDQQRGYGQQESPAGHYGDNRPAQPMPLNRHGHPAEQMQFSDLNYADQQSMMASRSQPYPYQSVDQRQRYGTAGAAGSHTLPPLGSSASASGQPTIAGNPAFQLTPNDGRYAPQPQGQRDYNGYQSGYPVASTYMS